MCIILSLYTEYLLQLIPDITIYRLITAAKYQRCISSYHHIQNDYCSWYQRCAPYDHNIQSTYSADSRNLYLNITICRVITAAKYRRCASYYHHIQNDQWASTPYELSRFAIYNGILYEQCHYDYYSELYCC